MDESREVIELINKLQKYFKSTGCKGNIELPQIVVVGAQSSGKSSVLDGLIGFSILPRGSGTVTKCPIIVQLINTVCGDEEEGIEFADDYENEIGRTTDYDFVRKRIFELMQVDDGAITDTPIIIKVYSPNVVTLTVVDLPGIKRLTSSGEPSDLEALIFNLCRKYIKEKNSIILAVSPANYDICNSDGLLLAKEADPVGNRTIGVLTKLDLMDEGTNAKALLTGTSKDVQVNLGMIGIVSRSQKDVIDNLSIEMQLEKERDFINRTYPDLAHTNGVPFLRKRLHELLVQHILKCLPGILRSLQNLLEDCRKRIDQVPNVMTAKDKYTFLNKIIGRFESQMKTEIEGSSRSPEYSYEYGGIKIKDTFERKFALDMEKAGRKLDAGVSDQMIQTAFKNSGSYDSMFVYPEAVFRKLAQNQIKHIEGPALNCAQRVHIEILRIAERNLRDKQNVFDYFPELKRTMKGVVTRMLKSRLDDVESQIKDYIRIQSSVVFSLDQEFLKRIADLRRKLERSLHAPDEETDATDREKNDKDEHEENDIGYEEENPDNFYRDEMHMLPGPKQQSSAQQQKALALAQINALPCIPKSPSDRYGYLSRNVVEDKVNAWRNGNRLCRKLQGPSPSTTELIKEMVEQFFNLVKSQTQDYVPKLVADRLITQFSSDGSLGDEMRMKVLENYEALVNLPANLTEKREQDINLKEHLIEVIAEIKEILDVHSEDPESESRHVQLGLNGAR